MRIHTDGRKIFMVVGDLGGEIAECNSVEIAEGLVKRVKEHEVLKETLELLMSEIIHREDIVCSKFIDEDVRKKVNDLLNSFVNESKW